MLRVCVQRQMWHKCESVCVSPPEDSGKTPEPGVPERTPLKAQLWFAVDATQGGYGQSSPDWSANVNPV